MNAHFCLRCTLTPCPTCQKGPARSGWPSRDWKFQHSRYFLAPMLWCLLLRVSLEECNHGCRTSSLAQGRKRRTSSLRSDHRRVRLQRARFPIDSPRCPLLLLCQRHSTEVEQRKRGRLCEVPRGPDLCEVPKGLRRLLAHRGPEASIGFGASRRRALTQNIATHLWECAHAIFEKLDQRHDCPCLRMCCDCMCICMQHSLEDYAGLALAMLAWFSGC